LLQGKLSTNVMERVCRESDGLFPAPGEIKLSCSCPDWADMCKHVAAVLYGVGARLDAAPELLFTLRGVDHAELVPAAGTDAPMARLGATSERVLADVDVAALFGLDMAAPSVQATKSLGQATAQSGARAPAQDAGPADPSGTNTVGPPGRRSTPVPATPAAKKAKRPDLAVLTRGDRARSKGAAASAGLAVARKTATAAGKAKAPTSPGKGSKAAVDDGSRRPHVTRPGRTKATKSARKARE
jgi:hypothetical protein